MGGKKIFLPLIFLPQELEQTLLPTIGPPLDSIIMPMTKTLLTAFILATCTFAFADAKLEILKPGSPTTAAPTVRPASRENVIIYKEAGRYGGWPANHGLWQWGDEMVVGFTST